MSGKFTVKNFSVVVPVHNEEEIILQSAAQIYDICRRKQLDFEIIFVENGSIDDTLSIIDKLEKKLNITVLSSNQTLIWDTLNSIKNKETTKGFGKIFEVN